MDPNKLKIGDFITICAEEGCDMVVARIISFDRYKLEKGNKLNGKICGADILAFPSWNDWSHRHPTQLTRISGYYLERCSYSSEAEVMAWFQAADQYEKELRSQAERVNKCIMRDVVRKRIIPMDKLNKWEYARLPPRGCINWVWSILKDFKIWDPKKNTVKIFGKTVWKYSPEKG